MSFASVSPSLRLKSSRSRRASSRSLARWFELRSKTPFSSRVCSTRIWRLLSVSSTPERAAWSAASSSSIRFCGSRVGLRAGSAGNLADSEGLRASPAGILADSEGFRATPAGIFADSEGLRAGSGGFTPVGFWERLGA